MALPADVQRAARGWRWTRRSLVPRSAEPHALPRGDHEFPTTWARSPAARRARAIIQRAGLKPLVWAEVAPRVYGIEVLRGLKPPVIFASNHASHLDAPLVLTTLPPRWRERTATGAAADYFFDAWWRATGSALAFNTFPVERRGTGQTGDTPHNLLDGGWNLLLFPEGTRSPDGWAQRFRLGVANLASQHGVPIVPIGIRGTFAAMPRGRGWPAPGRLPVTVRYGQPLTPEPGEDVRELTERMRTAVARLLDEDRGTWWDARRRAASDATPDPGGPEVADWRRIWEATRPLTPPTATAGPWRRRTAR